jgi:DNA-binding LytR/AlgR family response regulator
MKAIVIEDELLTSERMVTLVQKHSSIQVEAVLHSVKSAKNWLSTHPAPDLIFLDIQLGDGTGFDILDSVDTFPHIIFTTAYDEYVLEAFKFNSIDYLLKPIKSEELVRALEKFDKIQPRADFPEVLSQLNASLFKKYKRKFLVKVGLKFQSIPIEHIAYFYSADGSTYLRTKENHTLIIDQSLDELEQLIDPDEFHRVNRQLMVHATQISSIDSYFNNRLLLSIKPPFEDKVIVSREKVRAFKDWLDA